MANLIRFFILIFTCVSCKSENVTDKISEVCSEYLVFIKKQDYKMKKANEILISINKKESAAKRITAYRIAAQPRLLPFGLVPDKLSKVNDYDVLFFLNKKDNAKEQKDVENRLKKMNIYNDDAYKINSNYPEWVLLISSETKQKRYYLVKDAWYKPLDSLISVCPFSQGRKLKMRI